MGCGKSSVGKALAQKINFDLIDSDIEISLSQGMSIVEIFRNKGEAYFRQLEREYWDTHIKKACHCVIATGGGMPIHIDPRSMGLSIFLDSSFEVIAKRLELDSTRPLFDDNAYKKFHGRYQTYLDRAHIVIPSNNDIQDIVQLILTEIKNQGITIRDW